MEDAHLLVLGVTGHRVLAEIARLRVEIREALGALGDSHPGRSILLLSPLAEGADRIVAEEVLALPGGRLFAPLPLPMEEYVKDFETAESKQEFHALLKLATGSFVLPPAPTRNEAYLAVGHYVAEKCEVLLALWDGEGAQGRGGTGEIVEYARSLGKPVIWVKAARE